jgi:cytochrome b6-f complex iron-sulfur subunit
MSEPKSTLPDETQPTRRDFLNKLWIFLAAVGLAEFIGLAIAFLKSPGHGANRDRPGAVIDCGKTTDFKPNTVTAFQRGQFYLSCLTDGGFLALSRQCTHLGCTIPWSDTENKFICPCHASAFDITGNILKSPAPRALDLFQIVIENDMVKVDPGRRIRRSHFLPGQVIYPKKT